MRSGNIKRKKAGQETMIIQMFGERMREFVETIGFLKLKNTKVGSEGHRVRQLAWKQCELAKSEKTFVPSVFCVASGCL